MMSFDSSCDSSQPVFGGYQCITVVDISTLIGWYIKGESHFSVLPLRLTPNPCPSKPSGKR